MLRVDCARWNQSPEELRRLAVEAEHTRTRERFFALYEISQGGCATQVGLGGQRNAQTVMKWVHWYNERGPEALVFERTGGRPPFARRSQPGSRR